MEIVLYTNPGSPIKDLYAGRVLKDGSVVVEKVGEENLQEYIQSFKDECDLNNIIARFNNGDTSALAKKQCFYGDFTRFPKTYAEMLQLMIDSRNFFDSCPADVREKFDNDFNKFFTSCEDADFMEKLFPAKQDSLQLEEKESEVTE